MNFQKITLYGSYNVKVTADVDSKTFCRTCKKEIVWAVTLMAKKKPISKDDKGRWISHFGVCEPFMHKYGDRLDDLNRQKTRESWA